MKISDTEWRIFLGAVFDRSFKLNSAILKYAIETANTKILFDSGIQLQSQIEEIEYGNEFDASTTVCDLLNVSCCFSLSNGTIFQGN